MKQRIVENGKVVREFNTRDVAHLQACIRYHTTVTKNKKKYNRKEKHKNGIAYYA